MQIKKENEYLTMNIQKRDFRINQSAKNAIQIGIWFLDESIKINIWIIDGPLGDRRMGMGKMGMVPNLIGRQRRRRREY
jgi:hypothetical protein